MVRSKNRYLIEMLRNFVDTSIKIDMDDVQNFVTFRISVDFFYFFNICIFIEVSVKFRRILNKF